MVRDRDIALEWKEEREPARRKGPEHRGSEQDPGKNLPYDGRLSESIDRADDVDLELADRLVMESLEPLASLTEYNCR
jgi:hypothetical protein